FQTRHHARACVETWPENHIGGSSIGNRQEAPDSGPSSRAWESNCWRQSVRQPSQSDSTTRAAWRSSRVPSSPDEAGDALRFPAAENIYSALDLSVAAEETRER